MGLGSADLDDFVVGAVMQDVVKGIMVGNYAQGKSFTSRVAEFAEGYGLSQSAAMEYVINHELAHVAGYDSEAGAEGFLRDYFLQQAALSEGTDKEKYIQLAEVAEQRAQEAEGKGK